MILPSAHLGGKITWACGKLNSNRNTNRSLMPISVTENQFSGPLI